LGLTHVALIFDGIIFLPNMIGKATKTPPEQVAFVTFATLVVAALGTAVQALRVGRLGCGFVLFLGSYSAFLACTLDAVNLGGLELMATMTLLCAPVVFFYSYFLRFLRHIVTPQVGGVMILLGALSLMPIAIELWQGGSPDNPGFGSPQNYLVGLVTMAVLVLLMLFGNGPLRLMTPILGLAAGCLTAALFGLYRFEHVLIAPWFGLPSGTWPGLSLDIGLEHLPLLAAFVMAALVSAMEGTGNIMLLQQISLRRFRKVDYRRVQHGLYADSLSKCLAGLAGGAPVATFCDNIPLLKMTRVASRRIGLAGAGILLCLAFLPKVSGFLLDLPPAVIGGTLVVVCAMLFFAGFGLVFRSGMGFQSGLILGLALCAGLVAESREFFPQVMPVALAPMLQNGVAMGGFTAIFLSTLLALFPKSKEIFILHPRPSQMPELLDRLEKTRHRLKIPDQAFHRLRLACEETFAHLIASCPAGTPCRFLVQRQEEGIFVEIVSNEDVDEDIDQYVRPFNALCADEKELGRLGLILLGRSAREVQHISISGYTYLSFLIDT
ncbi:MAG: hypothetical protein EOM25_14125, partial [Deltaproteobacteria bacterium]|nr:hypothetical protein [Deltaproteobacteria bacterium]